MPSSILACARKGVSKMAIDQRVGSVDAVALALAPSKPPRMRIVGVMLVIWKALTMSRRAALGSAIVGFFIVVGLIGPFFMAYDPNATSHLFLAPPSWQHLLGTTVVGEDIFSQLVYGTRTSVFWGLGTGLLLTILSVLVGLVAGFVSTTIYVVLAWAGLEFLGLGDGTIPSWGGMLYWAQQAGALGLWWWFIPPGACIAVLGAGLSLINFGIDEVADPRLHIEPGMKKALKMKDTIVKTKEAVA